MEVRIYPASQLGNIYGIIEMLQRGELHMGDIENAPLTNVVPETVWIDLPYIIQSYDHAMEVLNARSDVSRWIRPLFAENGLRVLGVAHGGFRHMFNNTRPINHPNDMEGLTMRSMASPAMFQSMLAFGSQATLIPLADLHTALGRGEADGWENAFSLAYSMNFYEVQRYLSLTGHFYNPRNYIFSEALWQQMSPAQQLIVLDATEYATNRMNEHLFAVQAVLQQSLINNGMIINTPSTAGMNAFRNRGTTIVWPMFYEAIGSGCEARGRVIINMILSYAD
jgi:tripartite ATP-independent transporter DctP family solute receptor